MSQREQLFDDPVASRRAIITPEGVPLTVQLADHGDRATAFIIDLSIWLMVLLLVYLPATLLRASQIGQYGLVPILLLAGFLIRVGYFFHFELAWQGATPGKRIVGLRVVDRRGGPLLPSAVIARNLTREFEIFMPVAVILSFGTLAAGGWASILSVVWILCIGALPFLNRDRMRGGDLIAGTMVIALPRRRLAQDLAEGDFHYTFTDQHLMAYGAFELQVLEEVLRSAQGRDSAEVLRGIGERIRRKIGWAAAVPLDQEVLFLTDFYAAERRFLERGQLFGKSRPDKNQSPRA